ncbi:MAG: hypothetical protein AAFV95_27850 [Bacteroidota bacterium]
MRQQKNASYFLLLICALMSQPGMACFCDPETIETANYTIYEELFVGKLLKIERMEVTDAQEGETYQRLGTIATFEVTKKWKGSADKIVKIYQEQNSCAIDFSITNSRWIIAAYRKSFVNEAFRKAHPAKHLQTDNCSLHREELSYKDFEEDIRKIDQRFPHEIVLHNTSWGWGWAVLLLLGLVGSGLLVVFSCQPSKGG